MKKAPADYSTGASLGDYFTDYMILLYREEFK